MLQVGRIASPHGESKYVGAVGIGYGRFVDGHSLRIAILYTRERHLRPIKVNGKVIDPLDYSNKGAFIKDVMIRRGIYLPIF